MLVRQQRHLSLPQSQAAARPYRYGRGKVLCHPCEAFSRWNSMCGMIGVRCGRPLLLQQEKQELEEQRVALMEEVQSYRNKIKQLEDDLLFRLSNSQARSGFAACGMFALPTWNHSRHLHCQHEGPLHVTWPCLSYVWAFAAYCLLALKPVHIEEGRGSFALCSGTSPADSAKPP